MNALRYSLVATLALNLALGLWVWRIRTAPPEPAGPTRDVREEIASSEARRTRDAALLAGDFDAMIAAGIDPDTARDVAAGYAFSRYREAVRRIQPPTDPDPRFWLNLNSRQSPIDPADRDTLVQAERQLDDALREIYGESVPLSGIPDLRLSFLPDWKQIAVRRLEEDYQDFAAEIGQQANGLPLPSDSARLAAIQEQREQELQSLLTPEERTLYDLRGSLQAIQRMSVYGPAFANEQDFLIYIGANQAYDAEFNSGLTAPGLGTGLGDMDAVVRANNARAQMQDTLRDTLGAETYGALQAYMDRDRQMIESLRTRLNLPADVTSRVLEMRERYSVASKRIRVDPALAPAEVSAQIRELGAQAQRELIEVLGEEAGRTYSIRQQVWSELLSRGVAFTTDRSDMLGGPTSLSATSPYTGGPRP